MDRSKREFYIAGRTFHTPTFKTATGRAAFHVVPMPPLKGAGAGELRLMTIRSEGQFNTVVYEEEDVYRGQERRDVILMHASDRARLGLELDQLVTVRSVTGVLNNILVRDAAIHPGNAAMYYPEANVLVPRNTDPNSGTPAFKSVRVTIAT